MEVSPFISQMSACDCCKSACGNPRTQYGGVMKKVGPLEGDTTKRVELSGWGECAYVGEP